MTPLTLEPALGCRGQDIHVSANASPLKYAGEPCVQLEPGHGSPKLCHENIVTVKDTDELDRLKCTLTSPCGQIVNVFDSCVKGKCSCSYCIGGLKCQLKPCRFAALVCESGSGWADQYLDLVWNITDGFPIVDGDVVSYECENYSSITCEGTKEKMDKIIRKELREGYVSLVTEKPTCVHALGAVPKSEGRIRPITDCSRPLNYSVNNCCSTLLEDFSFKNIKDVVDLLTGDEYLSVIDIKSAYRAVPIRPEHRTYQGFKWDLDGETNYYEDNRMCFGLRLGPSYFNAISNFIYDVASSKFGIKIINYLDDFLVIADTLEETLSSRDKVVELLRFLGFYVAFDKLIYPSKCVIYLGIVLDTERKELRLPEGKVAKLKALLQFHLSKKRVSKKNLESIGGLLSHCAHLVKGGRIFCSNTYNLYKQLVRSGRCYIKLSEQVIDDFHWWIRIFPHFNGTVKMFNVEYELPMVSDSSLKGFGVYLGSDWVAGTWRDEDFIPLATNCSHVGFHPVLDVFDRNNINELEMWPVVVGLKRWVNLFANKALRVVTDNTQVMYSLIKGCSSNSTCNRWLKEIFWICAVYNITLIPSYINTKSNLVADTLSRLPYFKSEHELLECLRGCDLCCLNDLFMAYRDNGLPAERQSHSI